MASSSVFSSFEAAADQFLALKAEALPDWVPVCQCENPGTRLECITCPSYRLLVKQMQEHISPEEKPACVPKLIPPQPTQLVSDEDRQRYCELYANGYSVTEIRWISGNNLKDIRRWLRDAGLIGGCADYSAEEKHRCLELYKSGLTPQAVEAQTRIPADVVSDWVAQAGCHRPKTVHSYSEEDKQRCIDLYLEGNSCQTVATVTGIPAKKINSWLKRAGAKRPKIFGGGRRKTYSLEFRERCLRLLANGQTATQVERALDVSADTVRRWKKEASQSKRQEDET